MGIDERPQEREPVEFRHLAELALSAARAVEEDLGRLVEMLVATQVGAPALLVGRQPCGLALGAARDEYDAFGVHPRSLRPGLRVFGSRPGPVVGRLYCVPALASSSNFR